MKVFCPDINENWILDRITLEYCETTSQNIVNDINECDTILLFAPFVWKQIPEYFLQTKKLILFLHHIVPQKFNPQEFLERDKFVDCYIVPNEITKSFIQKLTNKPIEKVHYWINQELWQKTNSEETRKQLGLENKFVIFSAVRDTEGQGCDGLNPLPKIEKNPEGLVQAIKLVQKNIGVEIFVILGGWRRQFIIKRLKEENIKFIYIERPELDIINALYDVADLCIQASLYEGGSQQIIECAYKKVPIISTDAGLASEILSKNCVFDVTQKFYLPTLEDIECAHQNVIEKCDMKTQIRKIDAIINSI